MKWKRFLGRLCCHKAVFLRGVTSTLNSFYATKRQPLLFFNEKCGLKEREQNRGQLFHRITVISPECRSKYLYLTMHSPNKLARIIPHGLSSLLATCSSALFRL